MGDAAAAVSVTDPGVLGRLRLEAQGLLETAMRALDGASAVEKPPLRRAVLAAEARWQARRDPPPPTHRLNHVCPLCMRLDVPPPP